LKKCKSKTFKIIHEALKKCLKIKLKRLPQDFITNIKIDFNKKYLEKTILEIYQEYAIIPSLEDFKTKGYLIPGKVTVFEDFLNLTFQNVFEYYIHSKQYVKDYQYIQKREGDAFAVLFNYVSQVFVQYYTNSKGNKPKKISLKRKQSFDSININNINMNVNVDNVFPPTNKVEPLCPVKTIQSSSGPSVVNVNIHNQLFEITKCKK